MGRQLHCDICKKPTDEIVGKLFYAPMVKGSGARSFHNNYQLHLDVGVCCRDRLLSPRSFKWTKRVSAKEYNDNRRKNK